MSSLRKAPLPSALDIQPPPGVRRKPTARPGVRRPLRPLDSRPAALPIVRAHARLHARSPTAPSPPRAGSTWTEAGATARIGSRSPTPRRARRSARSSPPAPSEARAAVAAAHAAFPGWAALPPDERAAPLRRAHALRARAGGRAGPGADAGGRQAARRGRGRGALGGGVPALVRGGDPPPVGRDPRRQRPVPAALRAPPPARRRGLHHAVELPQLDDHAQAGAGRGGRQHGRARSPPSRRRCRPCCCSRSSTRPASRPAWSTSCAATRRRSARSSRARRRCASSPSRARSRSGGCSPRAARRPASTRRSSSAGTRRSSSSPTPTSSWRRRSSRSPSSRTPARRASRPTACWSSARRWRGSAELLVARVRAVRVGDGLEPGVTVGPLIDGRAVAQGARPRARTRWTAARAPWPAAGPWTGSIPSASSRRRCSPTCRSTRGSRPRRPSAPWRRSSRSTPRRRRSPLANASEYGLAAYLFTRDLGRAHRVGEALDYGMVGVNDGALGLGAGAVRRDQGLGRRARGRPARARGLPRRAVPERQLLTGGQAAGESRASRGQRRGGRGRVLADRPVLQARVEPAEQLPRRPQRRRHLGRPPSAARARPRPTRARGRCGGGPPCAASAPRPARRSSRAPPARARSTPRRAPPASPPRAGGRARRRRGTRR